MARKRRGREEGGIYQRADGLWCAAQSLGYGPDGKRKRRVVYGATKQEVLAKLRNGLPAPSVELTVGRFLSQWLETIQPTVEPLTHGPYERHVRLHITPHIGHLQLTKLKPLDVEGLYQRLSAAGVSATMVRKIGTTLSVALGYAVKREAIPSNPADYVKKPKAEKAEKHPFNAEEVKVFLRAATSDRLFPLYVLLIDSGMRPGEAFALEVTDLQDEAVSVTKSLEEISGKLRVKATKTRKSRRLIRLSAHTLAVLAEHAGGRRTGPLFTDTDGGYLRIGNVTKRSFQPTLARAGLGDRTLYDLRHTMATLLLAANVNPKIVSERLGHSSVMLTLDTYSHVLPGMQDVVTANMGEWLQLGYSSGCKAEADVTENLAG